MTLLFHQVELLASLIVTSVLLFGTFGALFGENLKLGCVLLFGCIGCLNGLVIYLDTPTLMASSPYLAVLLGSIALCLVLAIALIRRGRGAIAPRELGPMGCMLLFLAMMCGALGMVWVNLALACAALLALAFGLWPRPCVRK